MSMDCGMYNKAIILREEKEEEEKERKCENYKRARFDRLESGGEKNSWSHGHWVRCEWTRTRRKEPPQWWEGCNHRNELQRASHRE